jgi:hypothetical protein
MRELSILFLYAGVTILLFGYVPWWVRHDDVTVRTAQNIMTVVAGWALTIMGYLGLLLTAKPRRSEARGFPVTPPAQPHNPVGHDQRKTQGGDS